MSFLAFFFPKEKWQVSFATNNISAKMQILAFQKLDQIGFDKFYLTQNVRNLKFALFTGDETTRFNLCVTLREQPGRFRNKGRNIAIYPIGFPGVLFNIIATQGHKRWVLTQSASFGETVSNVEQNHCKHCFGFVHKCELVKVL